MMRIFMEQGKISEDVFEAGVDCSAKTMYPDWLSMSGKGYIASMYKQYGKVISPMGCRAFLSPWYERGGMHPADDKDVPIFVGRFNIGAVSLHLPMILAKARAESRDFYEVLDFYLEYDPKSSYPYLCIIWARCVHPPILLLTVRVVSMVVILSQTKR